MAQIVVQPARALPCAFSKCLLVSDIVVDNPFAPERGSSIDIEQHARPTRVRLQTAARSGIETDPAIAGKVSFHPGMCVAGPHHVLAGEIVEFAAAKSGDDAGRNA